MGNSQLLYNSRWRDRTQMVDNIIAKTTSVLVKCHKETEDPKVEMALVEAREVNRGMDNNSVVFNQLE